MVEKVGRIRRFRVIYPCLISGTRKLVSIRMLQEFFVPAMAEKHGLKYMRKIAHLGLCQAFNYVFVNENRIVATDAQRMLILSEDGGMSWTQVRDLP